MEKSTLMKNGMTLYHQDIILKKEPRSYQRLRTMVNDILEQQQQHTLRKELKEKAKIVEFGCQKARSRKAENVLSNMEWKSKENQSRIPVKREKSAERQYTRMTGRSPPRKKDRLSCFNYKT